MPTPPGRIGLSFGWYTNFTIYENTLKKMTIEENFSISSLFSIEYLSSQKWFKTHFSYETDPSNTGYLFIEELSANHGIIF